MTEGRDFASRDWYKPLKKDLACAGHPKAKRALVKALAEHARMSESLTRHMLDRIYHLSYCLDEPDSLLLRRLQPGSKQTALPRVDLSAADDIDDE